MGAKGTALQARSPFVAVFMVPAMEVGRRVSAAALSPAVSRGPFE